MKRNQLMQLFRDNARAQRPAQIKAESAGSDVHVYVNDVIDSYWGASAASMLDALKGQEGKTVHLHINSPGGDVFEARAMSAAIVAHTGKVVAHIDGICASAATYLALAASEVRMTEGGLFMIHNSWTVAYGNKADLRESADLLDKIDGTISADYMRRTGASLEQVQAWMDATTWFTAQEALDAKFIDAIDPNTKQDSAPAAKWNLSAYPNAPKDYTAPPAVARQQANKASVKQTAQIDLKNLTPADTAYLTAMVEHCSAEQQLSRDFVISNPDTMLRGFAEEVIEDEAGSVALMSLWIQSAPPTPPETQDRSAQAANQMQHNRNRLRLCSAI